MRPLTALIFDDEKPAREELRYLLEKTGQVSVIGMYGNADSMVAIVDSLQPDVVFLDIQMPGIKGTDSARLLKEEGRHRCLLVFSTAYDDYAVEAFELDAADYILKPFDERRIDRTIARIRKRLWQRQGAVSLDLTSDRVPVEKDGRYLLVKSRDITFACARGKDTVIKCGSKEYVTRFNLQELEERLPECFMRVHRSYIINLEHVREVIPWFRGNFKLVVDDPEGTEIPVSRQQVKEIRDILGV